jgi:hypothetical protein
MASLSSPRRRRFVPRLLVLEDRTLPSTFTVLNRRDDGPGSLRALDQQRQHLRLNGAEMDPGWLTLWRVCPIVQLYSVLMIATLRRKPMQSDGAAAGRRSATSEDAPRVNCLL